MRFGVVTLFPELIDDALGHGVLARAGLRELISVDTANPRAWASDPHRTVDDRPFGGGPGMVMKAGPLTGAIDSLRLKMPRAPVVYLSPQGRPFDQPLARQWQAGGELVLVAGRYEGVDERVIEASIDEEVSLGDFVLSGGEFAALAIIDAVSRLVPEVLGHPESANEDSFGEDGLLDCPHYTRPEQLGSAVVPAVLLSGDHQAIARWRRQQAVARTRARRPDLLAMARLDEADKEFLQYLEALDAAPGSSSNE